MTGGIDVAALQLNTHQHICLSAKLETSAEISSLIKNKKKKKKGVLKLALFKLTS